MILQYLRWNAFTVIIHIYLQCETQALFWQRQHNCRGLVCTYDGLENSLVSFACSQSTISQEWNARHFSGLAAVAIYNNGERIKECVGWKPFPSLEGQVAKQFCYISSLWQWFLQKFVVVWWKSQRGNGRGRREIGFCWSLIFSFFILTMPNRFIWFGPIAPSANDYNVIPWV